MGASRILLADCDQMFVAVARLADPDGAGKAPILIVGGSAKSRGVVCSASYEARTFGVRSGMPLSHAGRLCPSAVFVPVPRHLCGLKSREVARVLDRWAPKVEAASIDEFYLDLTGTEAVYRGEPLAQTAATIRTDLLERTGMTLSFGGGTNRLVAKLATERAKPRPGTDGSGVFIVPPGEEGEFLATHSLSDVPGVGPRLTARLRGYGLLSVRDALRVGRRDFERWLGPRSGAWLHDRIRGLGSTEVDPDGEAKSMSHEETFPRDITTDRALETELLRLATTLAAELRRDGLTARCVTVKLRDHDFKTRQASRTVDRPIDTDRAVFTTACELLEGLRDRRRVAARLLGIGLTRLEAPASTAQLSLLGAEPGTTLETDRDRAVARAMDAITTRFGRDAVRPARLTPKRVDRQ